MMLENLFARSGQEEVFLYMTGCGFLFGMLLHLSGMIRRSRRLLGALGDLLSAAALGGMLLMILLHYGGGVRAYGLLGLLIGALLYWAGVSRLIDAMAALMRKLLKRLQKTSAPKEGILPGHEEMITHDDALRKE